MLQATNFTNEQFYPDMLPDALDVSYQKLAPSYRTYSLISATIGFGFFFLLVLVIIMFAGEFYGLYRILGFFAAMALLYIIRMVIKYYGYGKKGFAMRRHDVLYKSGILWKRNVFIPKSRIQHVEIKKTPLEDIFDICRLMVFTAGGSGSDLVIPGLLPDEAERMKENLMQRIADDQEE